ncbi:MAG: sulfite exporter TauE/SafE family protein [Tessaracoccus sp.]
MDGQSLVLFAFAVFLGASTHRLTGMGFSLVSSPLLVIAVGPHDAVAVLQIFGVLMSVFMLVHVWRDVDWGVLWWLTIPALVGIIPGVLVARRLSVPTLEVLVGLLVVVALSITAIAPRCRVFKGRAGASAVGAMSGFMNATASLSGAPLALYRVSAAWDHKSFVATVQVYFVVVCGATLAARGLPGLAATAWGVSVLAVLAGIGFGSLLVGRLSESRARTLVYLVALAGGLVTLAKGLSAI